MARVFIGVDPHKLSATIEVVDNNETVLASGRFSTDKAGYAAMRKHVASYPERVWAVEGSNGAGRPLAQRLLADGEQVVDVPAKLSARARLLDTGHNRKTDAHDAHAVAVVAARTTACGCWPMTPSSRRCGCWSTAATSSAKPGYRRRTGCTGCCPNSFPDRGRRTSPPARPRPSWLACGHVMSPGRPAPARRRTAHRPG